MNPTDLRDRMTDLVGNPPFPIEGSAGDLSRGRKRLRRRRAGAVVAGSAAAVVAAGGFAALQPDPVQSRTASAPHGGSGPDVLERCLELGADALPGEHFGPGTFVLTAASDGGHVRAVLVAGDGQQWADCALDPEGSGAVARYAMQPPARPSREYGGYVASRSGPPHFSMLERFPDNVAEVELRFRSGAVYTADAVDGFVVFEISDAALGDVVEPQALRQYDAQGRLVGGPGMAPGDADLPVDQRSLVPATPLAAVDQDDD